MTVYVRYDTTDENGKTRRERNEGFEMFSPVVEIPEIGQYLWDWYRELSESTARVSDGVCHPVSASAMKDWSDVMGHIVYHHEYAILRSMDRAFCSEMNKEFKDYRDRMYPPSSK